MNEKISNDGYMSKAAVAQRFNRTPRTIEQWMRKGYLPFLKIGRAVLFHWPSVEQHLRDNHQVIQPKRAGSSPRRWRGAFQHTATKLSEKQ